jgi:chromosome segregation ATPase
MTEEPMFEGTPEAPSRPRRRLAVALVVATVMALATLGVATWLFLDRQELQEDVLRRDQRIVQLREDLADALDEGTDLRGDVRATERERDRLAAARDLCRSAIRESVELWNDLVEALRAVTDFDLEAVERYQEEADERRDDVNRALRRCERT